MRITKHNQSFNVDGEYSQSWFKDIHHWEPGTFHILDTYKNTKKSLYIDIGGWIGPTVLYGACIYDKVIAVEPDPVAIQRLEQNMSVNEFKNITLVKKGLADKNGRQAFGGNGDLGNSESTLLIANDEYLKYDGRHTTFWKDQQNNVVEIDTITIETLISDLNIDPEGISLMKMDIEGGEIIVVPSIRNFLFTYRPVFFISLHYCFLKEAEVRYIIDILFEIYNTCYWFGQSGDKNLVSKADVINRRLQELVFEHHS